MKIAIASGKGGTGKTFVATNLAMNLDHMMLVDLDVEEPNDHIFFNGELMEERISTRSVPRVDRKLCNLCGKCAEVCEFRAIAVLKNEVMVFDELCHDCGACNHFCPENAIRKEDIAIGKIIKMRTDGHILIYGELNVGEPMATPLIRDVKRFVPPDYNAILDCPPGISCPVVESVRGCDYCVLVAEPSPMSFHDLKLAHVMLNKLKIPAGMIINKDGIPTSVDIEGYCKEKSLPLLGRIPFSREIAEKYARGELLLEDELRSAEFRSIWNSVIQEMKNR